jgi:hypothetical protein
VSAFPAGADAQLLLVIRAPSGSQRRGKETLRLATPTAPPHGAVRRRLNATPWNNLAGILKAIAILRDMCLRQRHHPAIIFTATQLLGCRIYFSSIDPKVVGRCARNKRQRDGGSKADRSHDIPLLIDCDRQSAIEAVKTCCSLSK